MGTFLADADLTAFLQSGVAIVVGTRDRRLAPAIARAWGGRVGDDRKTVEVFVAQSHAGRALDNLRENGCIAVNFCLPLTYRSVQLKGRCTSIGEVSESDSVWIERHLDTFVAIAGQIGIPPHVIRNLAGLNFVRVAFQVDEMFDQTPGIGAGKPM
jgi:hypothetical protein